MPKMKTSSGAKKKFKVTATGKILRRNAGQSHNFGAQVPEAEASVQQGRRRSRRR